MSTCNPTLMPISLIPRGRAAYHSWPESQAWSGLNGAARRGLRGSRSAASARNLEMCYEMYNIVLHILILE